MHWDLLALLLFALALGCYQRSEMPFWIVTIREELRLSIDSVASVVGTFVLASAAGFWLMAVFIWRQKSWLGCAVLGILGVIGALLAGASRGVGGLIVARGIGSLAYGGLLLGAYRMVGGWLPQRSHGLAMGLVFAVTESMKLLT